MTSGADEIEAMASGVAQERAQMDETLKEIRHKLTPGQLVDEVLRHGGEPARNALGNLGSTIAAHPIPALLVGVALLWMAVETHAKGNDDKTSDSAKT